MLTSYIRYEEGKSSDDYYHKYFINIPNEMWRDLGSMAKEKHSPISTLVRTYIAEGMARDKYYG